MYAFLETALDGVLFVHLALVQLSFLFSLSMLFSENSGLRVFDLKPYSKGKTGRPSEFLKNYKSSLDFLAHLEGRF